jgi:hypothetical protein
MTNGGQTIFMPASISMNSVAMVESTYPVTRAALEG